MLRRRLPDVLSLALLFVLPLIMFWQQTLGGRTLLPAENLYQTQPYASYREELGVPAIPQNQLLDDLVLENLQWKSFIRESFAQGEFPLWNPHQFAGIPFFAAGQPSTLYPFSILYYVLDLASAYGWFTVAQLWLAGACMYAFMRGLHSGRFGALVAGIIYQLSGFFVISAVFPMIIASAAWLPLLLLMIEYIIRQQPAFKGRATSAVWVIIGAAALGCSILAGHVEITYYTLIIMAYYAAARLLWELWTHRSSLQRSILVHLATRAVWLCIMVGLGLGLGAVQFIPLFEVVRVNFRSDSASLQQVREWGHPARDVLQFVMPNFYGNPAHHSYFDVFSGQNVSLIATVINNASGNRIVHTDWGMKNYVEGALYLGILPLALAIYALIIKTPAAAESGAKQPPYRWIFAVLALSSLTFMFGLPTYALLYYLFPGINQLHSPFRWIFAVTLCVAALAGFGAHALTQLTLASSRQKLAPWFGYILTAIGALTLVALLLSRIFYPQIEPIISQLLNALAKAPDAFSDARMFYSYQFVNILIFAVITLLSGITFLLFSSLGENVVPNQPCTQGGVLAVNRIRIFTLILIAVDLMIAAWGFNPASDPAWLNFTPPAITWMQENTRGARYTTFDDSTQLRVMNANIGMRYGLDDIRGYESIIPRQYVDYMEQIMLQVQLESNRIAPIYVDRAESLESPLLDLLNVYYVVSNVGTDIPGWNVAYEDAAVRIWENEGAVPRAYLVPADTFNVAALTPPAEYTAATITSDTGREQFIDVSSNGASWLVVSQSYFPGWRAFIRPQNGTEQQETPLEVQLVQANFQGVYLPDAGNWTVRLVYSPSSFQIGGFTTGMSAALLLFMGGVYLWRLYIAPQQDGEGSNISRVARNSIAPILLNLFNRGIDFAFAIVMLRILGPADAGLYAYVVVIFMWFDIFTNFGLNLFLVREVSRDRSRAGFFFFNTSVMRFVLIILGIPLVILFFAVRQNLPNSIPLDSGALIAIAFLYIGLLPSSLSTGLTALYYAFEKAEYPAAVQTITTINKAIFGLIALMLGWGFVGLAGVSIVTNVITLVILLYNARGLIKRSTVTPSETTPKRLVDFSLMSGMARESFPLMLNHFLATIFFQIDVVILQPSWGDIAVGQYSTAYKWLQAINVIPAFFTQALLPSMSRQAHEDPAALKRTYTLAIKLLVLLALPFAVFFTFMAVSLTTLLGGAEYLPDGAIALQIMIWSIPIGWMNSLTQYVLIALDLQRRITTAFVIAVSFNIISNLLLIPTYGYRAAALTTIASELVLLIPFALLLQRGIGKLNWVDMLWRPIVATAAMLGVLALGWNIMPLLALIIASVVYVAVLLFLRPLSPDEMARLSPLLPARVRTLVTR